MKFSDLNFRHYLDKFVLVPLTENMSQIAKFLPSNSKSDGLMSYAYYDREEGCTLEVLCPIETDGHQVKVLDEITDAHIKIRTSMLKNEDVLILDNKELYQKFADRISDIQREHGVNDEVAFTRTIDLIDEARDAKLIDNVHVHLLKDGCDIELCPVRIEGLGESYFKGTLLCEPNQNFDVHTGDLIQFVAAKDEHASNVCISDLNNI